MREVKYIPLTNGLRATVDAEDYEELAKHKWSAVKVGNTHYAARVRLETDDMGEDLIFMHRQICKVSPSLYIKHTSGNGLANQKNNFKFYSYYDGHCSFPKINFKINLKKDDK